MYSNKIQINFFYALFIIVLAAGFFIFLPFLKVLFLSAVCAVLFYPLHRKLTDKLAFRGKDSFSAFIIVLFILLIILIPFAGLSILIFREISSLYVSVLSDAGSNSIIAFITNTVNHINGILPSDIVPQIRGSSIRDLAGEGYNWVFEHFQTLFSSVFNIGVDTFILILSLFFFLRDGKKFKDVLVSISPLNDAYDNTILNKIELSVSSVIKGTLLMAVIQGLLAGIGFFIFGVPSAVLWGSVSVLAAIIPSVGTAIILLPAVVFVFFTKGFVFAIGLLIWGTLIVGLADNILRPLILERGIKIHPFVILLSILGGLSLFGPIGFLAGPVILSLLFTLAHIYPLIIQNQNKDKI